MNLKIKIPDCLEPDVAADLVFSLPFDINDHSENLDGCFAVTHSHIYIYENGTLQRTYSLDDIEEYVCEQMIGSSMLCGKIGGEFVELCAFTQKYFIRYAEVAKLLDYYHTSGTLIEDNGEDEPVCPKCGLPLYGSKECLYCANKGTVFSKLLKRCKPYIKYFVAAIVFTFFTELIAIILPYIKRLIIDDYIVPQNGDLPPFLLLCGLMLALLLITWLLDFFKFRASFRVATGLSRDLRQDVFAKAQQLSLSSISKKTAGELIQRVSSDTTTVQDFLTNNGRDCIIRAFSILLLSIILIVTDPRLALFVLMPLPLVAYLTYKLDYVLDVRYGNVWRNRRNTSTLLHDILNGIRVVKSFGNEQQEISKYTDASLKWANSVTRAERIWYLSVPLIGFIMTIGQFFVLAFGGEMVLGRQMQLGELIQYTTYIGMIYGPLWWVIQLPRMLSEASVSASRVLEVLDEQSEIQDKEDAVSIDIKGDIRFENVSFGYKAYKPVLKEISCEIKAGEMVGIVGHSGVGKSTMINLIMRLYDPTQGRILIDGVDIRDISQHSLRSQVGVVLQETFLFDGSVYDNIRYAKPEASFEEIIQAAKIANAHDFIVQLPDGYNTRVGDRGYSLSGGERQRVAIARAILHNPKILILDEATASLDTQTEKQIQDALDRLIKGRTTIAIAHRLSTLSNADRLIVLHKGRLSEIGHHDELMRNKGVYYDLVMAQRQTTKMKAANLSE